MDEKDSIIAMRDAEIMELKQVIENQKKEIELLRANIDFAMGKTETNDSLLGGPTPQEILENDAKQEMHHDEMASKFM